MIKDSNKYYIRVLLCLILVQCIYAAVIFATQKQGFHSDELWNYGFANSSSGTHVFKEDVGNIPKNADSWQSVQLLRDYITVDKSEIFAYVPIYWNAEHDYNPPLGYMLLHFICSFFPGSWSKWYNFMLNIICFVISQIYLYKLVSGINKSPEVGIYACLFYGFTMAAVNVNIFLRIYAPAVMFGVMLMYYAAELYNKRGERQTQWKLLLKLFIVNFAGCFTLHLFLPFAFIITAMYCLYYLFTKRFGYMVKYGLVMSASVALSFAAFPATVKHVFGDNDVYSTMSYMTKRFPPLMQYKMYWSYITNDLFGVHFSMWKTMTVTYIGVALLLAALILIPVCFLLRNEDKFKNFVKKTTAGTWEFLKKIKNFQYTLAVLVATVIFVIIIAARSTSVYGMGRYSTRYIFMLYPLLAAFAASIAGFILGWIFKKGLTRNIISAVLCIVFAVMSMAMSPKDYYFRHDEDGKTFDQLEENANCIIVMEEQWVLTCLTCELFNTNNYFLTDYDSAFKVDYNSDKIKTDDPLYLLLDDAYMDDNFRKFNILGAEVYDDRKYTIEYKSSDYLEYFKNLDISTKLEYVGMDAVFGREFKIYRLN